MTITEEPPVIIPIPDTIPDEWTDNPDDDDEDYEYQDPDPYPHK